MTPSPVNAPLSLSPADDYRPFPRQESLGPFPYRRSFVPSPSVVTFPIEAPTFIRHTSTINRPHPHPRCLVPFLRRNFIVRSPIHVPWSPSPASNHRPLPRPHSLIPSPRWGCIVPCPVDAASSRLHWATIVPSPVHDQSVLPPDDAAPSPPAQVSHRPHKARQCCIVPYTFPSPTGLSSPPHTLVNAPSSVDVPSPVHCHPPPSRLHHSLYRCFPRPRSIIPSLVRDPLAVGAVPSPGPQVYHRYHTPPSMLHRSCPRRPFPRRHSSAPSSSGLPSSLPSCMLSTFPSPNEPPSSHSPWAAVVPFPPSASHRRLLSRPRSPSPIEAPWFLAPSHPSLGYRRHSPRACVPSPVKRSFRR